MKKQTTISKKTSLPFRESAQDYMVTYGVDFKEAIERIQSHYEKTKLRNDERIQKQLDSLNTVQAQMISHSATLSTLILTATGLLISQTSNSLDKTQIYIIMTIIVSQTLSLLFGGMDYLQTANFHKKWLKVYANIDTRVAQEINNGEMQYTTRIGEIEQEELNTAPESTVQWITTLMLTLCGLGLLLLPVLFFLFFFV